MIEDWLARSERHASIGYVCVRVKRGAMWMALMAGGGPWPCSAQAVRALGQRANAWPSIGALQCIRAPIAIWSLSVASDIAKVCRMDSERFLTNRRSMETCLKNGMVLSPSCAGAPSDKKSSSRESRLSFCLESMVKL